MFKKKFIFLYYFNILMLKIFFKKINKIYYLKIFISKKYLKSN